MAIELAFSAVGSTCSSRSQPPSSADSVKGFCFHTRRGRSLLRGTRRVSQRKRAKRPLLSTGVLGPYQSMKRWMGRCTVAFVTYVATTPMRLTCRHPLDPHVLFSAWAFRSAATGTALASLIQHPGNNPDKHMQTVLHIKRALDFAQARSAAGDQSDETVGHQSLSIHTARRAVNRAGACVCSHSDMPGRPLSHKQRIWPAYLLVLASRSSTMTPAALGQHRNWT